MDLTEKWKGERERKAFLALDDGTVFHGVAFGARKDALGEVVFNTGMSGYQEILTDPSYAGQFVTLTTAEVGNYGINGADTESRALFLSGLVIGDLAEPSNWRSEKSLGDYLAENGVPGIYGVDTRALTLHIREHGNRKAYLCTGGSHVAATGSDAINCVPPDIVLCEIGGVSGDIESLPFLEAARQFRFEEGTENTCFVHLTLVPYLKAAGELKTKPSQHSVGMLRNIGIIPDILVCRTEMPIPEEHKAKLALFCNVRRECVIEEQDVTDSVYAVPRELRKQGLDEQVLRQLHLDIWPVKHTAWDTLVRKATQPKKHCRIALVGKYITIRDAYKSIHEALQHAGMEKDCKVEVVPIEAEDLLAAKNAESAKSGKTLCDLCDLCGKKLSGVDGILVPGGFGARGVEGKIAAIKYAREHKVPFLGICLGMQCTVIEYARDVLGWADANSTEFDEQTAHPVIDLMEEQRGITQKGGTMRLGAYPCVLKKGSLAARLYAGGSQLAATEGGRNKLRPSLTISERHRHRYEFAYDSAGRAALVAAGLEVSGLSPDGKLVEIVELPGHPYFIACQFHPEFKSRPTAPHPLFVGLVSAALAKAT